MNKATVAAALACAAALPVAALGQSSVTIGGLLKGGFESLSYGQSAKSPAGQTGVVDDSSRIIFRLREELGGGLAAIGRLDLRFGLDSGALAGTGNNHVGLQSRQWGRIFLGRQDLHYFNTESELTIRGSLRGDSISLLSFAGPVSGPGAPVVPVAGQGRIAQIATNSRTANVVHYTTPNWGGFTLIAAYSSDPLGAEGDIGSGARKGRAWNLNPNFSGRNFQVGYSYWDSKPDSPTFFSLPDQRSDRLYGSYTWGGLKIGLAWDRSRLNDSTAGVQTSNRTAWSIPVHYAWGRHGIYGHYTRARDDKAPGFAGLQSGARMVALSYAYDFSRRTSLAVTYAKITNDANAAYSFFTSTLLGLGASGTLAGEDPRMWGVTVRHAF